MHVKIAHSDGQWWHRLTVDRARRSQFSELAGANTACGIVIKGYYATREESYEGELCRDGCFTPFELEIAETMRRAEEERFAAALAEERAESKRRADDVAAARAAAQKRLTTATDRMAKVERGELIDDNQDDTGDKGDKDDKDDNE